MREREREDKICSRVKNNIIIYEKRFLYFSRINIYANVERKERKFFSKERHESGQALEGQAELPLVDGGRKTAV